MMKKGAFCIIVNPWAKFPDATADGDHLKFIVKSQKSLVFDRALILPCEVGNQQQNHAHMEVPLCMAMHTQV